MTCASRRFIRVRALLLRLSPLLLVVMLSPVYAAGPKPPVDVDPGVGPATVGDVCRLTAFAPYKTTAGTVKGKSNFSCSQQMYISRYITHLVKADAPLGVYPKEYFNFTAAANVTYYAEPEIACIAGTHQYRINTGLFYQYPNSTYVQEISTYGPTVTITC